MSTVNLRLKHSDMKKQDGFNLPLTLLAAVLVAGCATNDPYDICPDPDDDGIPTAVEWQTSDDGALAAATTSEVLRAFVASDEAADGLLRQIKMAYKTDPVVMTQIGCVTQLVLDPKWPQAPSARRRWAAALRRRIGSTADDYVKAICTQQLWLCE